MLSKNRFFLRKIISKPRKRLLEQTKRKIIGYDVSFSEKIVTNIILSPPYHYKNLSHTLSEISRTFCYQVDFFSSQQYFSGKNMSW